MVKTQSGPWSDSGGVSLESFLALIYLLYFIIRNTMLHQVNIRGKRSILCVIFFYYLDNYVDEEIFDNLTRERIDRLIPEGGRNYRFVKRFEVYENSENRQRLQRRQCQFHYESYHL